MLVLNRNYDDDLIFRVDDGSPHGVTIVVRMGEATARGRRLGIICNPNVEVTREEAISKAPDPPATRAAYTAALVNYKAPLRARDRGRMGL